MSFSNFFWASDALRTSTNSIVALSAAGNFAFLFRSSRLDPQVVAPRRPSNIQRYSTCVRVSHRHEVKEKERSMFLRGLLLVLECLKLVRQSLN